MFSFFHDCGLSIARILHAVYSKLYIINPDVILLPYSVFYLLSLWHILWTLQPFYFCLPLRKAKFRQLYMLISAPCQKFSKSFVQNIGKSRLMITAEHRGIHYETVYFRENFNYFVIKKIFFVAIYLQIRRLMRKKVPLLENVAW